MARNISFKKKNLRRKKRTGSQKLTQAEIEARLTRRASAAQEKFLRLEQSQIVTQDTMRLEFQPFVTSTYVAQTDKLP